MPPRPVERTAEQIALAAQQRRERDRANCRRHYWKDHERTLQRKRAARELNKSHILDLGRAAYARRKVTAVESYQRRLERQRTLRQERKDRCYAAYGGYICRCCGVTEPIFLSLDHIADDGASHRREIGTGAHELYRWLIKHNFPLGFQVLCHNCNWAKACGGCPHQVRLDDEVERMVV